MPNNPAIIIILTDNLNKKRGQSILKKFKEKGRHSDTSLFTAMAQEEVKYYCLFLHKNQPIVWKQHIHNLRFPQRGKKPKQEQKNRSNHAAVG